MDSVLIYYHHNLLHEAGGGPDCEVPWLAKLDT